MVDKTSHMFITGPEVIKTVTGEDVEFEELGGARSHQAKSGVAHFMAAERARSPRADPAAAVVPAEQQSRRATGLRRSEAPTRSHADDLVLDTLIPDSANHPYDMHTVIEAIVDDGDFLEVQPLFAPNIIIGFGRVDGRSLGVVANQPMQFAGTLDIDASEKAARFVRTCDAFNVPVLTLVDVPGFLPGTDQEWDGIIRRGAKLIYAYAEATVPLVTIITRKAYGGAYDVMGSKHLGADINLAWPTAQIAVMGAQGAVNILHRKEIAEATERGDLDATRAALIESYEDALLNPYLAAERGYIDAVIEPVRDSRPGDARASDAAHQAREPAAQEARKHSAVSEHRPTVERIPQVVLRVVRGDPEPDELAALVAVLAGRSAQAATEHARQAVTVGFALPTSAPAAPRPHQAPGARRRFLDDVSRNSRSAALRLGVRLARTPCSPAAAGVDPEVIVSGVDEDGVTGTPGEVALVLAQHKATAVVDRLTSTDAGANARAKRDTHYLVLGCDSVLELDGSAHGKPADAATPSNDGSRCAGRRGVLHTGHSLVRMDNGQQPSRHRAGVRRGALRQPHRRRDRGVRRDW